MLLFLPNEQLTGFIHEHDPALLDEALGQRVVMCSPLTLFAFLGVIRQAFDNFMIEQTSDEILKLIGTFDVSSGSKYTESAEKVKNRLDSVHASSTSSPAPAAGRSSGRCSSSRRSASSATSRSTASCSTELDDDRRTARRCCAVGHDD